MYNNAFEGAAWHGSSIMKILERITSAHIKEDPERSKRIAKVVNHMLTWRTFSMHVLKGGSVYEVAEEDNWKDFDSLTDEQWQSLKSQLVATQNELNTLLEKMEDRQLDQKVISKEYDLYILLHGMIQHDLYHLGEITALTQKLN